MTQYTSIFGRVILMPHSLSELTQSMPLPGDARDAFRFDEPWQAQAFAITVELHRRGHFSWAEWVEIFSKEIQTHPATPEEGHTTGYYRQWLAALETILAKSRLSRSPEIDSTEERWRSAYLHTPHGRPIEIHNAGCHIHEDEPMRPVLAPVMVSPAQNKEAGLNPQTFPVYPKTVKKWPILCHLEAATPVPKPTVDPSQISQ
jgi:nitrile hydratase accessory protein